MTTALRSDSAIRGLLHPAAGPLLRAELHDRSGQAVPIRVVIDTGASMSAIDADLGRRLNLPSPGVATWRAITDAERDHMSPLRSAGLRVVPDRRIFPLDLIEVPALADRLEGFVIHVLLGWDFLQRCKLTIDGPAGSFSLELPNVPRRRR